MRRSLWIVAMLIAALVAVGAVNAASSDDDKDDKGSAKAKVDDAAKSHPKARGKSHDYSMVFKARLSGDQEVVAEGAPDPSKVATTGKFKLKVSSDYSKAKFKLRIRDGVGIFGAAGAHIHCAPAGKNGPVVAWLAGLIPEGAPAFDGKVKVGGMLSDASIIPTDPKAEGATCPSAISDIASLAEAAKAGYLYVNVHSFEFPGGVVRGQIEQYSHPRCVRHEAKGKHRKASTFGKKCVVVKTKKIKSS